MAPEQATDPDKPIAASDWYAVGGLLYEALTGRRPFLSSASRVLSEKLDSDPVSPQLLSPDADAELARLSIQLLARNPDDRPDADDIARRLELSTTAAALTPTVRGQLESTTIVGRQQELEALGAALDVVRRGGSRTLLVSGRSGMGKSELVDWFLDQEAVADQALVLRGRCFERETVPYKALDTVVDSLAAQLAGLTDDEAAALIPAHVETAAQLFPVLRRVDVIDRACKDQTRERDDADQVAQRRAFAVIYEILARASKQRPIVIYIDDLQWGDPDSVPLLARLSEADMPLLMIVTARSQFVDQIPILRLLRNKPVGDGPLRELVVDRISADARRELAGRILGPDAAAGLVDRIAEASDGSPYFLIELARHAASKEDAGAAAPDLNALLQLRADEQSTDARQLLDIAVVAGGRLPVEVALLAMGESSTFSKARVELATNHLVRTGTDDTIEPFHDRIRSAVLAEMPQRRQREVHRALAVAFDSSTASAAERVFAAADHHYRASHTDHQDEALERNLEAARASSTSYAHGRAYVYFEQASAIADKAAVELDATTMQQHADAAARAGHVERATALFGAALEKSSDPLQRAALQLGQAKIHLGSLDTVKSMAASALGLREVGRKVPTSSIITIASTLFVWLGGLLTSKLGLFKRTVTGRVREKYQVICSLVVHVGLTAYFRVDKLTQVLCILRLRRLVAKLGPSRELAEWNALAAAVASIAGKARLSDRLVSRAVQVADDIADPIAAARVRQYRAHSAHFLGRVVDAEQSMRECLDNRGQWLENVDYLTAAADYAWNTLMRGYAQRAWSQLSRGLARADLDGQRSELTQGHTYRCYAGPTLAMLGRVDDGRKHLDEFRLLLEPDDPWRWPQWLAHRTLFLVESRGSESELDDTIAEFRAVASAPKKVPLQIRHFYIAQAIARLRQLERQPDDASARERFAEARADLKKAGATHPTLQCHYLAIEARFAALEQTDAEDFIEQAAKLARSLDNVWVQYELALLEARLAQAAGNSSLARRRRDQALSIATQQGWVARLAECTAATE